MRYVGGGSFIRLIPSPPSPALKVRGDCSAPLEQAKNFPSLDSVASVACVWLASSAGARIRSLGYPTRKRSGRAFALAALRAESSACATASLLERVLVCATGIALCALPQSPPWRLPNARIAGMSDHSAPVTAKPHASPHRGSVFLQQEDQANVASPPNLRRQGQDPL